eukprot:6318800-Pyramimonas_sp.AAC.2
MGIYPKRRPIACGRKGECTRSGDQPQAVGGNIPVAETNRVQEYLVFITIAQAAGRPKRKRQLGWGNQPPRRSKDLNMLVRPGRTHAEKE